MKVLTLVTQQAAVRHVTHERVFKQISRVRRQALPKQQTCSHETVECRLKFRLLLAHHSLQERMRELAPDCRPGLCDFLRGSKAGRAVVISSTNSGMPSVRSIMSGPLCEVS